MPDNLYYCDADDDCPGYDDSIPTDSIPWSQNPYGPRETGWHEKCAEDCIERRIDRL